MAEVSDKVVENLATWGGRLHVAGQHDFACTIRQLAYDVALAGSLEEGCTARQLGDGWDKLGRADLARGWAHEDTIHDNLVRGLSVPTRAAYRERAASAKSIGVGGLHGFVLAKRSGQGADGSLALDNPSST